MKTLHLMFIFQCNSQRSNMLPDGTPICAENEKMGFYSSVHCCDVGEELLQMADKNGDIVSGKDGKTIRILAPNVCLSSGLFRYK